MSGNIVTLLSTRTRASDGQAGTHSPQPMQSSLIISGAVTRIDLSEILFVPVVIFLLILLTKQVSIKCFATVVSITSCQYRICDFSLSFAWPKTSRLPRLSSRRFFAIVDTARDAVRDNVWALFLPCAEIIGRGSAGCFLLPKLDWREVKNVYGKLSIFSGNANPQFARAVSECLGVPLGRADVFEFPNENIFVRINDVVREQDVFVMQPTCSPVNRSIMELLIMIDALKRASAARITAVLPYYGYGRTDKKDQPRVPITARLIADMITVAGANRVLSMDLHAGQIQGFFSIPFDELTAINNMTGYFRQKELEDVVIVAPDLGSAKKARNFAERLGAPLAVIEKRRKGNDSRTQTLNVIGQVAGRQAIIIDDEIDTGSSLMDACRVLQEAGISEIFACCTHSVLSGPAVERIRNSPLKELVTTDTIPLPEHKRQDKIVVLSVAPLFAEVMKRIHDGGSVGAMFDNWQADVV